MAEGYGRVLKGGARRPADRYGRASVQGDRPTETALLTIRAKLR